MIKDLERSASKKRSEYFNIIIHPWKQAGNLDPNNGSNLENNITFLCYIWRM